MKAFRILFLLVLSFTIHSVFSQSIFSLTVHPAHPSFNDSVKVVATLNFPQSSCTPVHHFSRVSGSTITASSGYCMGTLTALCSATDTFELGKLPAGHYKFNLDLFTGITGILPCTLNSTSDDAASFSFFVDSTSSIGELSANLVSVFPNPVSTWLNIVDEDVQVELILITSITGELLHQIDGPINKIDVSTLPNGVYFLKIRHNKGLEQKKFIKSS